MTMTTTTAPSPPRAIGFYERALPLVETLLMLARAWRDNEPCNPEAIRAHSELTWLAIRFDLRLGRDRQRELTTVQTTGAGLGRATTDPGG